MSRGYKSKFINGGSLKITLTVPLFKGTVSVISSGSPGNNDNGTLETLI